MISACKGNFDWKCPPLIGAATWDRWSVMYCDSKGPN